ncbi:helix-turn-helix domain-containing protein, partial [Shewanella sp. Isolate13]
MNDDIQQRLVWIELLKKTKNAGLVCRRCGITRPTLRKWWQRYQEFGKDGLVSQSKRPHSSPNLKVTDKV